MYLESEVEKQLCERTVRSFLDILILSRLDEGKPIGGYDFAHIIHEEFSMHMSPGTVYANLYALEREGLVTGQKSPKKRVYEITDEGREFLDATHQAINPVQNWIKRILKARK